jgi:heptosyltransferase-2
LFDRYSTHHSIIPLFHFSIVFTMGKTLEIQFSNIRKVMVRAANWVGDAVLSLPAIHSLRLSLPNAEITILAKPWVSEIFQGNTVSDRVILYQSPGIHKGFLGKWRLAGQLKKERFDLAFLIQNAFEAALISFMAGIPQRAGYNTDGRTLLLTHPVTVNRRVKRGHQVDYYLELVRAIGFQPAERIPSLKVAEDRQQEAEQTLKSLGVGESDRVVGISPGATYGSAKEWFPERYGELAGRIAQDFTKHILIFGNQSDQCVAAQVRENARFPLIDLTGATSLAQAIALIARCQLFITNDSGLMHVAAALKIPLIAIFGSTDPKRTGPLSDTCRIVHKAVPCAPCLKTKCPEDRKCMGLITVDEVYEEVRTLWGAIS